MAEPIYQFELWIPQREGNRAAIPSAPVLTVPPYPDWGFADGGVLWTINDRVLIDQRKGFYPEDQLVAVLGVVESALDRQASTHNVGGTIINISTEPIDAHRARFAYDLGARRVSKGISNEAEHIEIVGNIKRTAESVVIAVDQTLRHLSAGLSHPRQRDARGHARIVASEQLFDRLERVRVRQSQFMHSHRVRRKS